MVRRPQSGLDPAALPLHRLSPRRHGPVLAALILLVAVWLRAPLLWSAAPLEVDEALFATYARQISHENDGLLAGSDVDKPPLAFYLTALSFKLFGEPSEWAARLPGFYASLLTLACVGALARRVSRRPQAGWIALLWLAACPFDITYAASVFTDPLATLWTLAACLASILGRWGWSGALAGLAFATKQNSLQFLPLIVALGWLLAPPRRGNALRFLATFGAVALLPFAWSLLRPATPDWWSLGVINNSPGRLIRSDEVLPRLAAWLGHLASAAGGLLPAGILLTALLSGLIWRIKQAPRQRSTGVCLIIAAYSLVFLLVYWLVAFNTYDRYLHPWPPLAAVIVGILAAGPREAAGKPSPKGLFAGVALAALLLPSALAARGGDTLLAPSKARSERLPEVAAYLNTLPPGTIVYDRWLGWQLGWYTGQHRPPGMWLRVTYYPTPEEMATAIQAEPDPALRCFVAPDWVWLDPWLDVLRKHGIGIDETARIGRVGIYAVTPSGRTTSPADIESQSGVQTLQEAD